LRENRCLREKGLNVEKVNTRKRLFEPLCLIWIRRQLFLETVKVSLRQRYAGATLGLAWIVIGPILLLSLYATIYLVVFQVRPVNMEAKIYVLYIFSGLVPFINFSQGLIQGTTALSADREVLLNTVYPPELVPLREIATSVVTLAIGVAIICVVGLFLGNISVTWLLVPVVLSLMLMFLTGLTWILSLANLVLKDIQQLLTYVTIILIVVSPIAYTPEMLPSGLKILIYFNPLAYFIICIQSVIVLGSLPHWPIVAGTVVFGTSSIFLGAYVFNRAKMVFFDYA
jgi:lipopolysaccharide transport system permease protein